MVARPPPEDHPTRGVGQLVQPTGSARASIFPQPRTHEGRAARPARTSRETVDGLYSRVSRRITPPPLNVGSARHAPRCEQRLVAHEAARGDRPLSRLASFSGTGKSSGRGDRARHAPRAGAAARTGLEDGGGSAALISIPGEREQRGGDPWSRTAGLGRAMLVIDPINPRCRGAGVAKSSRLGPSLYDSSRTSRTRGRDVATTPCRA